MQVYNLQFLGWSYIVPELSRLLGNYLTDWFLVLCVHASSGWQVWIACQVGKAWELILSLKVWPVHQGWCHLTFCVAYRYEFSSTWYISPVDALHAWRFSGEVNLCWLVLNVDRRLKIRIFISRGVVFRNLNRKLFLLKWKGAWSRALWTSPFLGLRALLAC